MSSLGNKEVFSRNLRALMQRFGKSRNQVCDDLGFKYTTFNDWYNGNKYPRINKIEMLADYFHVLKSDLIEDKTNLPSNATPLEFAHLKRIPILGRIAAGTPIYAEENIEGYTYTDLNGGSEYFGLRVHGDSMDAARIHDGDVVIVRRQETVENGQISAVLIDSEEATLKRVKIFDDHIVLEPENPMYKPLVFWGEEMNNVRILGKATHFISKVD